MADDRMKNDDQDWKQGQQAPGRNPQGGQQTGGQQGGTKKDSLNLDDDEELDGGMSGQRGGHDRGGQNR